MARQNILLVSAAFLLLSCFAQATPTSEQLNSTFSKAPAGAHHVLVYSNGTGNGTSQLNHQVESSLVYCSSDSTCWRVAGTNSDCYNGYCICDLGYHSSGGKCVKTSCTYDSECYIYQANTRCTFSTYPYSCVCNYGYYKDVFSQSCLLYNYGPNAGQVVGYSFLSFVFLIIIISLCVICCRRRRARIIRVVGPQVQQQPRPGFVQPQPQANYYQQPQQSYQQQSMPMPQPAAAYPNPNYQTQQQAPPPPYNPTFAAPAGYPAGGKI